MRVGLLLITWNRYPYITKAVEQLLSDPADFQLYVWDNGSGADTRGLLESIDDPRVVERHYSPTNVGQTEPCFWFFERCRAEVMGKVDDDILLPHGWTERLSPLVLASERIGMLGCWPFMESDWLGAAGERHAVVVDGIRMLRGIMVQGHSFLARSEVLRRYAYVPQRYGLAVDRWQMTLDGFASGYVLPLLFAHNMDDPRSPHCAMTKGETFNEYSSLTARFNQFASPSEFADWIAKDAWRRQAYSFRRLLWWERLRRNNPLMNRLATKLLAPWKPR